MIDDHTAAQIIVRHVLGDRYANTDWVHERAVEAWRELRATSDLKSDESAPEPLDEADPMETVRECERRQQELKREMCLNANRRADALAAEIARRGRGGVASVARDLGVWEQTVRKALGRRKVRRCC